MKVTYHKWHSFRLKGRKYTFRTQLYGVAVYGITNEDPSTQTSFTPTQIKKGEDFIKEDPEVKNLQFGPEITVSDETGFWEEV